MRPVLHGCVVVVVSSPARQLVCNIQTVAKTNDRFATGFDV